MVEAGRAVRTQGPASAANWGGPCGSSGMHLRGVRREHGALGRARSASAARASCPQVARGRSRRTGFAGRRSLGRRVPGCAPRFSPPVPPVAGRLSGRGAGAAGGRPTWRRSCTPSRSSWISSTYDDAGNCERTCCTPGRTAGGAVTAVPGAVEGGCIRVAQGGLALAATAGLLLSPEWTLALVLFVSTLPGVVVKTAPRALSTPGGGRAPTRRSWYLQSMLIDRSLREGGAALRLRGHGARLVPGVAGGCGGRRRRRRAAAPPGARGVPVSWPGYLAAATVADNAAR